MRRHSDGEPNTHMLSEVSPVMCVGKICLKQEHSSVRTRSLECSKKCKLYFSSPRAVFSSSAVMRLSSWSTSRISFCLLRRCSWTPRKSLSACKIQDDSSVYQSFLFTARCSPGGTGPDHDPSAEFSFVEWESCDAHAALSHV